MMSGYNDSLQRPARNPRIYRVVVKAGGWAIALGDVCTFPFKNRDQAHRIARSLQQQADALANHRTATKRNSYKLRRY